MAGTYRAEKGRGMHEKLTIAMIIMVTIIVISFFLPWVQIESQQVGAFSKMLTGKRQVTLDRMSAFQVPLRANSSEARLAMSVLKIFAPNMQNADKKSFLIWIVPLCAVGMFLLRNILNKNMLVHLGIGVAGCLIFIIGLIKIVTADLDKLVLNVRIAPGLWLTLVGFLGIGVIGFMTAAGCMKPAT